MKLAFLLPSSRLRVWLSTRISKTGRRFLYAADAGDGRPIRMTRNRKILFSSTKRDRTFYSPFVFSRQSSLPHALSMSFLMVMHYVEGRSSLDEVEIENLERRIALPSVTHWQKVRNLTPIGMPLTEEIQEGGTGGGVLSSICCTLGNARVSRLRRLRYKFARLKISCRLGTSKRVRSCRRSLQLRDLVDNDNLAKSGYRDRAIGCCGRHWLGN